MDRCSRGNGVETMKPEKMNSEAMVSGDGLRAYETGRGGRGPMMIKNI